MPAKAHRRSRNDENTEELTVRPTGSSRVRTARRASPEEGLSVDADELGTQFLSDATEQGNFESQHEPDLSLTNGAATDEPMLEGDEGNLWDQTIRSSPRSDVREIVDVAIRDEDERADELAARDDNDEEPEVAPPANDEEPEGRA